MSSSVLKRSRCKLITVSLSALWLAALLLGLLPEVSLAHDTIACARKDCGVVCSQPHPAEPCMSGMLPGNDCVCYTDFTIEFPQTVRVTANQIDKDCGGGRSGWFIIRNTDWTEAYALNMFDPENNWSSGQDIIAGTYRLEPSAQWGGVYCVEYWSGSPDCSGDLNMPDPDFDEVGAGECSSWRPVTFENNGNIPFTIGGILSSDPVFQVNLSSMPGTLDPGDDCTFQVRFCPLSGLSTDTPYSAFITVNYICNSASNSRQIAVSGMGHVPIGELLVSSSFDVGEADWTNPPPGNLVERSLRINNVGDASMTVNATITDDAGGVFSLPTGGSVGTIVGGNHSNLLIRARVTAETDYVGQLRVEADYGGGAGDVRYVDLLATGHHPVPILDLHTLEINYGEVEVGYHFRQAIEIVNVGDAPLTFDIRLQDPTDPDAATEFDLDLGSKGPTASGDTELYEMIFHPTSNGDKEVFLVINNTNEEPPTSKTVRLYGSGTDPLPLSTMLVIDRSSSMNGMAGVARKIEAIRDAGNLYATLIMRDDLDYLGITKYNQSNSTPVHLGPIATNLGAAQGLLNDITGQLLPDGSTGIGGAMQTAAADFLDPSLNPPENGMAMILLTDGKENEEPLIADVKPAVQTANPELHIYCVGIGDPIETGPYGIDGIETSKLQAIADEFQGMFRVIQSISGMQMYDLERFYFKVFAQATGRQLALDPMYFISFSTTIQHVFSVNIITCDRDADFLLISELFKIPDLQFHIILEDPTGQIIESGSTIGGIGVHVKSLDKYKLVRVKFPPRTQAETYAGLWNVYLKPIDERTIATMDKYLSAYPSFGGNIPIAFMVSVGSDYRLEAFLTPGEVLVGETVHVMARTTEAWWPIPGADVRVTVTRPDGSTVTEKLCDDGLHDDGAANDATFGMTFTSTTQKGYYDFFIRSNGTSERGENVVREMTLSKYIGKNLPDRPEVEECIPCWLLRLIIIFVIFLLLCIFFMIWRCCCKRRRSTVD